MYVLLSHLELLWVFFLRQFEAKLVCCAFQLADLLRGLGERLLQLAEFLVFLLLQFALYALLLLLKKLPEAYKLCGDQLLLIPCLLLEENKQQEVSLFLLLSV